MAKREQSTGRLVDFCLKIHRGLYKAKYISGFTKGQILFFCEAKIELLYSPGSYKNLKLANFGQIDKIGQLELGIYLEPRIHKIKWNAF
jgi:hypothetical protein